MSSACRVISTASQVEFEPVPPIVTPFELFTAKSITLLCSFMDKVADSPVEPHTTRPATPFESWNPIIDLKPSQSTGTLTPLPLKGVTMAVKQPLKSIGTPII